MEPTQGIGRLKLQNQIAKWIALVMLIVALAGFLMGQAAPKKQPTQTQVVSGVARPRPDPSAFSTYEDYVEALADGAEQ